MIGGIPTGYTFEHNMKNYTVYYEQYNYLAGQEKNLPQNLLWKNEYEGTHDDFRNLYGPVLTLTIK